MPEPLVSIVMNCYNGEKYLRQAIDSIFKQTYQNWEIIFWDNQSNDKSSKIFKSYKDSRLKYFYSKKHSLLCEARNYAIEKANGEFIAFLDVDDWWMECKLKKQMELFVDPKVGFVCGNYFIVSEKNKNKHKKLFSRPVPTGYVLNDLLKKYYVGLLTLIIRKRVLDDLDYMFNEEYHIVGDFELVLRMASHEKMGCLQQPIAYYRIHDNNASFNTDLILKELKDCIKALSSIKTIRFSENFRYLYHNYTYIKASNLITKSDKKSAFNLVKDIPLGSLKLKLLLLLLIPQFAIRRFKN